MYDVTLQTDSSDTSLRTTMTIEMIHMTSNAVVVIMLFLFTLHVVAVESCSCLQQS